MNNSPKILAFAGSARKDSSNQRVIKEAKRIAQEQGAAVTFIDLADFPAAVYNGDDEIANGIPQTMREFKQLLSAHDAFIIATPEYNGQITPLLLNVFSWASRPEGDEAPKAVFAGKPAAIMAASPGALAGIRAIPRLRETLADLDCIVINGFVTVGNSYQAFDEYGRLKSEQTINIMTDLINRLIENTKSVH